MKIFICSLVLISSYQAAASECLNEAGKAALAKASKVYKISEDILSAEYVTGESLDSDTNSDGSLYVTPSFEIFEIKNKNNGRVIVTYSVSVETITDNVSGDLVECGISDIERYEEQ